MTDLKKELHTTDGHIRALADMGITSVRDLLLYFPRSHLDLRKRDSIRDIHEGMQATIAGVITQLRMMRTKSGKFMIQGELRDDSSSLRLSWFNQPYVTRVLKVGDEVIITGTIKLIGRQHAMQVGSFEKVSEDMHHSNGLIPVYRGHKDISSKWLRDKIFPFLPERANGSLPGLSPYVGGAGGGIPSQSRTSTTDPLIPTSFPLLPEILPDFILTEQHLLPRSAAVRAMHFPESEEQALSARKRLAYEELLLLQLASLIRKRERQQSAGKAAIIPLDETALHAFTSALPFTFTKAQKIASLEILRDISQASPMHRLLIGETGSGKTAVASLALYMAKAAGLQSALLAPTEILAKQHMKTALRFLHPLGVRISLLTGSTPESEKKEIKDKLRVGTIDCVIGTHALLTEDITFHHLGLAIIDEQHRFGVKQRSKLSEHGTPHTLLLTATPIPRTLALTVFGDTDVSILDELPPGRQEVTTRIVPEEKRQNAERWIESEIAKGRQVFIVCPLVADSDTLGVKSAKGEYERLQTGALKAARIALLHGKMKTEEKDRVMREFADHQSDILVSTSVIEVGIDVPNASIIVIEGAERFGLSQLHQFRGRVGRGTDKSYCFLFASSKDDAEKERLKALEREPSGFRLAEIDLRLRGPGELFGTRQSGIPDLRVASFLDAPLITETHRAAEHLLETDPTCSRYPTLWHEVMQQKLLQPEAE